MNKQTLQRMQQMKLHGMHRSFSGVLESSMGNALSSDELLSQLIEAEYDDRQQRKVERLKKNAKLRYNAQLEEVQYHQERQLDKVQVTRLAEGDYITKAENLIITGSTGVGKSYLACALGHHACEQGVRVGYFVASRLFSHLRIAKQSGLYIKEMTKLQRTPLLIIDDFGLEPIDASNGRTLLEITEDRYQQGAMIITSQLPVESWYELFGESTVADAILDRLVHNAHRINLYGESMRKKTNKI